MSPNETDPAKRRTICTRNSISSIAEENSDDSEFESDMEEEATYINDPVHGMLEIHPLCKAVIDTPEFQRLRFIKQCGLSYFVYPGATHTRFDHSLGVCYLALKVVKRLNEMKPDAVSEKESLCIQLAGLCHDLGHGPFSHTWEQFVFNATQTKYHHEEMSLKIFDYLIEKNSLREKFLRYGLDDDYLQLIKNLILGEPSQYKNINPKLYIFEIVANKQSGLDVDKFEYLIKDSYFFGIELSPNFERYLTCLKIVKDPANIDVERIGYREKLKTNIINVFKTRAEMHDIAYQHRVCKKVETMLLDALDVADKHIQISVDNSPYKSYTLSECHENVEAMLQLTDNVFERILYSRDESLKEAKDILIRILTRKHYIEIYSADLRKELQSTNVTEVKEILKPVCDRYNVQFHYRIKELTIGQSSSACDPLKNVWFVSRTGRVRKNTTGSPFLLPMENICKKLFIFSKDCVEEAVKTAVKETIELWMK